MSLKGQSYLPSFIIAYFFVLYSTIFPCWIVLVSIHNLDFWNASRYPSVAWISLIQLVMISKRNGTYAYPAYLDIWRCDLLMERKGGKEDCGSVNLGKQKNKWRYTPLANGSSCEACSFSILSCLFDFLSVETFGRSRHFELDLYRCVSFDAF